MLQKKVHFQPNTDGAQNIRKFDDLAKNFQPQSQEEHEFTIKFWTMFVHYVVDVLPISNICRSMFELEPTHERLLMGFILVSQDHEDFNKDGDESMFPKNTRFYTARTMISENSDRTRRRMQNPHIAGLEHISLVKFYVS